MVAGSVMVLAGTNASVSIAFALLPNTSLSTFQVNVTVEPQGAALALIAPISFSGTPTPNQALNVGHPTLLLGWFSPFAPAITGNFTIGVVTVPVPAAASLGDTYLVKLIEASGSDVGGGDVIPDGISGTITVGPPTTTSTTTSTISTTSTTSTSTTSTTTTTTSTTSTSSTTLPPPVYATCGLGLGRPHRSAKPPKYTGLVRLSKGLTSVPARGATRLSFTGSLDHCTNFALATKYGTPITGGRFKMHVVVPPGSTCASLVSGALLKSEVQFKFAAVNPATGNLSTVVSEKTTAASFGRNETAAPLNFSVETVPFGGTKTSFPGLHASLHILTDEIAIAVAAGCAVPKKGLQRLHFTGVGSTVVLR